MSQAYSNPDRESDPHALPDVEVFYLSPNDIRQILKDNGIPEGTDGSELSDAGIPSSPGFYWHSCFPGCLPDSDPNGPFKTKAEALADAQSNND